MCVCVCVRAREGDGACRCVFVHCPSVSEYACEFHGNSNWIVKFIRIKLIAY